MAAALENIVASDPTDIVLEYPNPEGGDAIACYGSMVDFITRNTDLEQALPSSLPDQAPDQLFYKIPYDWRVDNAKSAEYIADKLAKLDDLYGDADYDLYLVAHSNGGLVGRSLLENWLPSQDESPAWAAKLKKFITLATPHLGAPLAWKAIAHQALAEGEPEVVINFIAAVVDSSDFTSTAQLLPPENMPFISGPSAGVSQDIYSAADGNDKELRKSMDACGVNSEDVRDAKAFQQSLSLAKAPVPYCFFYGTGVKTLANNGDTMAFSYAPGGTTPETIFIPMAADSEGDGDGVVPAVSASASSPTGVTLQSFEGYTHGDMGGSDMAGHPASILAMLKACGITVVEAGTKAAE
jgi:pimeloyl-ACP methyl ester carboxylesterase